MQIETLTLLTIGGMAVVTYATRAGGLFLMERAPNSARFEPWLRHIPGAVLISIIAPAVLGSGPAESAAALITLLIAIRTRNLLLAVSGGVLVVWGLRRLWE